MRSSRKQKRPNLRRLLPDVLRIYRYFGSDIRLQAGRISWAFVALTCGVLFRLLEPWPLKIVLDRVLPGAEKGLAAESWQPLLVGAALAVIAIAAARGMADYLSRVGFFNVGNFVVIRVRDRLFRQLLAMPVSFHHRSKHGDLITRVIRDVNLLRDVTATAVLPLLGSTLVLVGMLGVMFWMSWSLTLLALMILPLYWLTTIRLGRRIRETARKQRKRESAMASIASEALTAIETIKALNLEQEFSRSFDTKNNQSQGDDLKASRQSLKLARSVDLLLAIATAAVLFLGTQWVLSGQLTVGELVVFLVYLKRSFKPAQEFAKYTARIAKATAAGERIIALLEQPTESELTEGREVNRPTATDHSPQPTLDVLSGRIEFDRVYFGYHPGQLVLKDFHLTIEPGQTVAVVGPSGAGKSTLISLLMRLYEPRSGTIQVDGQSIHRCKLDSVRRQMGAVLQPPALFSRSIRDNIAIARTDSVDADVLRAAQLAEVDEFALALPHQFDTHVTERSTSLSRGQRQRIAIARMALANRPILLLDEPTTGLDEQNRERIVDSLLDLARGRTALIVTHDMQLASRADRVVMIEAGAVTADGTHHQLIESDGKYARWFRQQTTIRKTPSWPE